MKNTPTHIVFYVSAHRPPDVYRRSYVPVFYNASEARAWFDCFLNGKPYERDGNTLLYETHPGYTTSMLVRIRCDQLEEVLAAGIPNAELRADHKQHILRFKYGTWDEIHTKDEPEVEDEGITVIPRAPKPERARRADAPPAFVTINALCAGSNVLPTHARAALRASGRSKPDFGWAFAPSEVAAIKKLVGIGS